MSCTICRSDQPVRHFEIRIDSEPLRLQPDLCDACGNAYLLRVGKVLGEMLRENGESGRPVSEGDAGFARVFAVDADQKGGRRPDITISGRPELAPICRRCGLVGHVAQRDSIEPQRPPGHNCRVAIHQEAGPFSPAARQEDDPDFGRSVRELEAARRDLPDQLAQHRGRGAEFPRDDATYVVEVTGKRCTACGGSGTVMVLAHGPWTLAAVNPHKSDLKRPETCGLCRGSGWL